MIWMLENAEKWWEMGIGSKSVARFMGFSTTTNVVAKFASHKLNTLAQQTLQSLSVVSEFLHCGTDKCDFFVEIKLFTQSDKRDLWRWEFVYWKITKSIKLSHSLVLLFTTVPSSLFPSFDTRSFVSLRYHRCYGFTELASILRQF